MKLQLDADLQANTIIHIGFSKCASKTLQNLFTVHEALTCINFHHTLDLLLPHPGTPWEGERAHRAFSQLLSEARAVGTIPIVSHERLTGIYDTIEIANRLHALLPHARVLICIREQIAMLASQYKHAVRHGSTRTVREYLMTPWVADIPALHEVFLRYRQVIAYYQALFGKERVCVKLVEELRDSPEAFYADLYRFLGIEPSASIDVHEVHHPGISDLETARRRFLNFFGVEPNALRDPNPFRDMPINETLKQDIERVCAEMSATSVPSIEAEVRALFQGQFAASNRVISELIGVDLAAFGYEVASETPAEEDCAEACEARFALEPMNVNTNCPDHRIIKYRGLLYALPDTLDQPDLRAMTPEERDALLQDHDLNTLKQKILADQARVRVVDAAYRGYTVVRRQERYYAVPRTSAVVDATWLQALTENSSAEASPWFVGTSETECRAFIDDLAALHWLEQHAVFQPLHGELSDFVAAPTGEAEGLFDLPPTETWAVFRLLWHSLNAALPQGSMSSTPTALLSMNANSITGNITDYSLLDCASRSSLSHPWSFASYSSWAEGVLLRDTPADIQIALSRVQLESAQGNWEAANELLCRTMEQVKTLAGGFTVVLSHLVALTWVHRLLPVEGLGTRIAQQAFTLLRDMALSFLPCPPMQRALVRTWQADAASQAFAYMRLGEALFAMDLLSGAEAAFHAAGDLTPGNAAVHNDLAVLYWYIARQKQESPFTQQALVHLGHALALDPTNTDVLVNMQAITSTLEVKVA